MIRKIDIIYGGKAGKHMEKIIREKIHVIAGLSLIAAGLAAGAARGGEIQAKK